MWPSSSAFITTQARRWGAGRDVAARTGLQRTLLPQARAEPSTLTYGFIDSPVFQLAYLLDTRY